MDSPEPYLEEDRFLVLLACGHWAQTRRPNDRSWLCPWGDGDQFPVRTGGGEAAVFRSWDYYEEGY
jgi:hypothetical protein